MFAGLIPAAGCAPDTTRVPPAQPAGWDDGIRLPPAADINPDPHVVELDLEARSGMFSLVPGGLDADAHLQRRACPVR